MSATFDLAVASGCIRPIETWSVGSMQVKLVYSNIEKKIQAFLFSTGKTYLIRDDSSQSLSGIPKQIKACVMNNKNADKVRTFFKSVFPRPTYINENDTYKLEFFVRGNGGGNDKEKNKSNDKQNKFNEDAKKINAQIDVRHEEKKAEFEEAHERVKTVLQEKMKEVDHINAQTEQKRLINLENRLAKVKEIRAKEMIEGSRAPYVLSENTHAVREEPNDPSSLKKNCYSFWSVVFCCYCIYYAKNGCSSGQAEQGSP